MFRRHAATPLLLPPVWLKQAPTTAADDTAFVLDRSGALLGLHAGGRAPLLPYLAVHPPIAPFKRYVDPSDGQNCARVRPSAPECARVRLIAAECG